MMLCDTESQSIRTGIEMTKCVTKWSCHKGRERLSFFGCQTSLFRNVLRSGIVNIQIQVADIQIARQNYGFTRI